ncbi:hypothetical protein FOA52_005166 [Chlamydomonas sp. UWO 241]|nr:hypothetical protein FOA52_005166 [Chlamydomonas sp. UWO 241]
MGLGRRGPTADTFCGHTAKVNSVCVSEHGDCVVSGGADRSVRLWRISMRECFKVLAGHDDEVTAVCISSNSSTLASASKDKTIRTYRVHTV